MEPITNTGFIDVQNDSDWAGANTRLEYEVVNPSGDWTAYLPSDERQSRRNLELMNCVTNSNLNSVETQLNFFLAKNWLSEEQRDFLVKHNYIDSNGKVNCSDRDLAYRSGTTPSGNGMAAVADALKSGGVLPEALWPWPEDADTWEKYYQPAPKEYDAIRAEFCRLFPINYDWVGTMYDRADKARRQKFLKQCPLQLAAPVCSPWAVSPVQRCETGAAHCTMQRNEAGTVGIFDTYEPFKKELATNYNITHVMRIVMMSKLKPEPPFFFYKEEAGKGIIAATEPFKDEAAMKEFAVKNGMELPLNADKSIKWSDLPINGTFKSK